MIPHTLFISDIHLQAPSPRITRQFTDFMTNKATQADALYILGDLFEFWIGDDDETPFHHEVQQIIKQVSKTTPVYFVRGNRDFLLGQQFAAACQMKILADPTRIELYGKKILLSHGDLLCTDDRRHQKYRRFVMQPCVKNIFGAMPISLRRKIATRVRRKSQAHNRCAPQAITNVNDNAVLQCLKQHHSTILVHGHTHQPNIHTLKTAEADFTRIVLGAWHDDSDYLRYQADGNYQLIPLRLV